MLKLDLSADVARTTAYLSQAAARHIPNAVAKALTRTAYDARDAVSTVMPQRFTIRRPWVIQGIGVTPANPRTLSAEVWSRDRFMALQETGGTKTGKLAIPVGRMAAKAKTQVIPKSQWPRAMLAKKGVFVRRGAVFERKGKAIQALYLLRRRQKVAPRFGMAQTASAAVAQNIQRQLARALREALTKT